MGGTSPSVCGRGYLRACTFGRVSEACELIGGLAAEEPTEYRSTVFLGELEDGSWGEPPAPAILKKVDLFSKCTFKVEINNTF